MSNDPDASATAPRTLPVPPAPGQRVHVSTTVTVVRAGLSDDGSWLWLDYPTVTPGLGALTLELDDLAVITRAEPRELIAAGALGRIRRDLLEHVAEHGVDHLHAHAFGVVYGWALSNLGEDLQVLVQRLHDEITGVRALHREQGLSGVRAALDVERATLGGAS